MESCLEEIKKQYEEIKKKYNLPSFDDLNKEFGIERVQEQETEYLLREIRKYVADKLQGYGRFAEGVLHPVNGTILVFSFIKAMTSEEKEKLSNIYKKIARLEIDLLGIEADYSEEKEAQFVKEGYEIWQEIKKEFLEILEVVKSNWDNKFEVNGKGYFG